MPAYAQKKRRTTKRRTTKKRTTQKRAKRHTTHRQGDVFNMGGPEMVDYRSGAAVHTGPSGYGLVGAAASMFQGRNQVHSYGLRPAPVAADPAAAAAAAESVAAASTSGDAVAQQRAVRLAMQRIIRSL